MKNFPITLPNILYLLKSIFFLYVCISIFEEVTDELLEQEIYTFDHTIIAWIHSLRPDLTQMMLFFTFFGSKDALVWFLFLSAGLLVWKKKYWETLFLVIGIGLGGLFNLMLKWIFQRERPNFSRLIEETGYSFPSGHSMGAFIFYGMLCMIILHFSHANKAKIILISSTLFLVSMVGLSRVYLGVHYPSDVIAGFAAGGAWVTICLLSLRILSECRKGNQLHSKKPISP
ncbi:phosphatase PAP2 family protein [Shimazuella kribbensis]|uniref:phosphatase PAP2 family protein n=1 Tax=Shimazuella kribbensis TaxID=139808 RepID=UPI000418A733|nr:phosphatase PAP2 family protein [Shimazuella kribbensis]